LLPPFDIGYALTGKLVENPEGLDRMWEMQLWVGGWKALGDG
jgi:hypothetical protein